MRGVCRRFRLGWIAAASILSVGVSRPAAGWDPSTTHVAMVDAAAVDGPLHRRWMEQSNLQRGLFSPIRVDPSLLSETELRMLLRALEDAHAGSGALPLGGPGACPGASAPASTQKACVQGDLFEATALTWLSLGIVVEQTPRARLLHHFANLDDPSSPSWSDEDLPRVMLRLRYRNAGGPLASAINRTGFSGRGRTAIGWLDDADDPWALAAIGTHLQQASVASSSQARAHHRGLALIGIGALLHVVQDLSVPAHARGDLTAFFAPLSDIPLDRGLPLQEYVRVLYGDRAIPRGVSLQPRQDEASSPDTLLASTVVGHLLGEDEYEGLIPFTQRHFLSESTLPSAKDLDPELDAGDAARVLLQDAAGLASSVTDGATLRPWPAPAGYVLNTEGRPLAAFDTDDQGRIRPFLDRRVYREQAHHLVPRAIEVSTSLLDLLFPEFPGTYDPDASSLQLDLSEGLLEPELLVMLESASGQRRQERRIPLKKGASRRVEGISISGLAEGERRIVVVHGHRIDGTPWIAEQALAPPPKATATVPAVPRPEATPSGPDEPPAQPTPEPSAEEPSAEEPSAEEPPAEEPGAPPEEPAAPTGDPDAADLRDPYEDVPEEQVPLESDPPSSDESAPDESGEPDESAPKSKLSPGTP